MQTVSICQQIFFLGGILFFSLILKIPNQILLIHIGQLLLFLCVSFALIKVKIIPINQTFLRLKPQSKYGFIVTILYICLTLSLFLCQISLYSQDNTQSFLISDYITADLIFICNVILAPFYEEFFFRGILLPYLALTITMLYNKNSSPKTFSNEDNKLTLQQLSFTIYLNALIFWLFHAPVSINVWQQALSNGGIPLGWGPFCLGLVCAWISLCDRSIVWAIVLHMCANAFAPLWNVIFLRHAHIFNFFYGQVN